MVMDRDRDTGADMDMVADKAGDTGMAEGKEAELVSPCRVHGRLVLLFHWA
jgi:hypothetical protein